MTDRNERDELIESLRICAKDCDSYSPDVCGTLIEGIGFIAMRHLLNKAAEALAAPAEGGQGAGAVGGGARKVSKQLMHWNGIPVFVDGVVGTHPNNWPLIDSAGGAKGGDVLRCKGCGKPYTDFPLDTHLPNDQWRAINDGVDRGVLCETCVIRRLSQLPGVTVAHVRADLPQPAEGDGAVLPVLDAAKGFADVNDDGDYVFTPAGLCEFEKVRTRPAATVVVPEGGFRWDLLPCYLIDNCEGAVVSEELLQQACAAMLADPVKYPAMLAAAPAAPKGGVVDASEATIREWVDRHDLAGSLGYGTDARCAFEDAQTAALATGEQP